MNKKNYLLLMNNACENTIQPLTRTNKSGNPPEDTIVHAEIGLAGHLHTQLYLQNQPAKV
jgi:hypothetical protein